MHAMDGHARDGHVTNRRWVAVRRRTRGHSCREAGARVGRLAWRIVVAAAILSTSLPPSLATAQSLPRAGRPSPGQLLDVALSANGLLTGEIRDRHGSPLRSVELICQGARATQQRTRTDREGRFEFRGLRGGVYVMSTSAGTRAVRLWAPGTAPPAARTALRLVADSDVVRGQSPPGPLLAHCETLKCWFANPLVVSGVVAAAVAIPVAIHNANRDRDSGS